MPVGAEPLIESKSAAKNRKRRNKNNNSKSNNDNNNNDNGNNDTNEIKDNNDDNEKEIKDDFNNTGNNSDDKIAAAPDNAGEDELLRKKLRNLQKKLRQIDTLLEKQKEQTLTEEQENKIKSSDSIKEEIQQIEMKLKN